MGSRTLQVTGEEYLYSKRCDRSQNLICPLLHSHCPNYSLGSHAYTLQHVALHRQLRGQRIQSLSPSSDNDKLFCFPTHLQLTKHSKRLKSCSSEGFKFNASQVGVCQSQRTNLQWRKHHCMRKNLTQTIPSVCNTLKKFYIPKYNVLPLTVLSMCMLLLCYWIDRAHTLDTECFVPHSLMLHKGKKQYSNILL